MHNLFLFLYVTYQRSMVYGSLDVIQYFIAYFSCITEDVLGADKPLMIKDYTRSSRIHVRVCLRITAIYDQTQVIHFIPCIFIKLC